MWVLHEAEALELLGAPVGFAPAAVVARGHPVHRPSRLRRTPVEELATIDRFDGPPLSG